jgi:hypothetical protein
VLVLVAAGAVWAYGAAQHLTEKYGDEEIARRMMKGVIWQGETAGNCSNRSATGGH